MFSKKKILFLFTELSGYFLSCIESLYDYEVHVVYWPVNKEAPFQLELKKNIFFYRRNEYSHKALLKLSKEISPNAIICCGWIDKDYIKVTRNFFNKIPTIITLDNHWNGSIKQYILSAISPFYLKKIFSHIWVPGLPQKEYAKKLTFKEEKILTNFYCANVSYFKSIRERNIQNKIAQKFIYIGRYVKEKGIIDLWNAFIELKSEFPNSWELYCIGTGPLVAEQALHSDIKHIGFVQPEHIHTYIENRGVFILPSHFEPWGVVIHEMASAGLPIICSDRVGASSTFVKHNKSGFIYPSGNKEELKSYMKKIMSVKDSELEEMSNTSFSLSQQISPETWRNNLLSVFS